MLKGVAARSSDVRSGLSWGPLGTGPKEREAYALRCSLDNFAEAQEAVGGEVSRVAQGHTGAGGQLHKVQEGEARDLADCGAVWCGAELTKESARRNSGGVDRAAYHRVSPSLEAPD